MLENHLWEMILTGAVGIGTWFITTMHKDIKENTESIGKLKGKTDVLKTATDLRIEQLTKGIEDLKDSIVHLNNNYKMSNKGLVDELRKIHDYISNGK